MQNKNQLLRRSLSDASTYMPSETSPFSEQMAWLDSPVPLERLSADAKAPQLSVIFEPGPLGMNMDMASGLVNQIQSGKQAERLGIRPGMYCLLINGAPYTDERLRIALRGGKKYEVVFKRQAMEYVQPKKYESIYEQATSKMADRSATVQPTNSDCVKPDKVKSEKPAGVLLTAGAHTLHGQKTRHPGWPNQDVDLVVPLNEELMLVAVFDGHGQHGHFTAARLRSIFDQHATSLARLPQKALTEALADLFHLAQETLLSENLAHWSGATGTVAMVDSRAGTVTVAHVGDSTLVICNGDKVVATTKDHKVDSVAERRILAHGGEVRCQVGETVRRIFGKGSDFPGLAMARALGDQEAQKLGCSFEPEFTYMTFKPGDTLIVASDGLWDVMSHQQVAAHITAAGSRSYAEDRSATVVTSLVTTARRCYNPAGDIDDITAVVVQAAPNDPTPAGRRNQFGMMERLAGA